MNTKQRSKLIQKWILYVCTKFGQNWLRNGRQNTKMAATKFSFFDIWTSDRGDFPRIIVIALLSYFIIFFIMQTGRSYLQIIPLILNQCWPYIVHTYKIHFWTIFVLCVVFKRPYFWSYIRKTDFFMYIFHRTVTHFKIVRLTRFFAIGSGHSN